MVSGPESAAARPRTGADGEAFGHKRLLSSDNTHVHDSAGRARDAIVRDIYLFYGDVPPADDITLVVGKVNPGSFIPERQRGEDRDSGGEPPGRADRN